MNENKKGPDLGNQGQNKYLDRSVVEQYYNYREVQSQVENYFSLGLSPIPLLPFTKKCITSEWQYADPTKLWKDFYANIGIRAGKGIIIIDADNEQTVEFFDDRLKNPTKVKTQRGAHYYLRSQPLFNYGSRKGMRDMSGDFRFHRSYVVAPISFVTADAYPEGEDWGDHLYELIAGSFANIPEIDPKELHKLITDHTNWKPVEDKPSKKVQRLTSLYIPTKYRPAPELVNDKIEWLNSAIQGQSSKFGNVEYPSRSEVYFSVVNILIRYNWNKESIWKLLEHPYDRAYFERTYDSVSKYLAGKELVETLNKLYYLDHPTKSETLVFKALVSLAYQFMRYNIKASNPDLRRITGIKCHKTIFKALAKLEDRNLITRDGWNILITKSIPLDKIIRMSLDRGIYLAIDSDVVEYLNLEYVLGSESLKILNLITEETQSLTDISLQSDKDKNTVIYHLTRLRELGIIETTKQGKNSYYYLVPNYKTKLYELMSDHMHENHLKIAAQQERYNNFLRESDLYNDLKKKLSPDEALKQLKQILQNS